MNNKYDGLRLEIYANGQFQGWVKKISTFNNEVVPTTNKMEARTFAKMETADKYAKLAYQIVRGTLSFKVA